MGGEDEGIAKAGMTTLPRRRMGQRERKKQRRRTEEGGTGVVGQISFTARRIMPLVY